jgi:rRNA-processing protein FCF1
MIDADAAQSRHAIDPGHGYIEEYDIRRRHREEHQGLAAVLRSGHLVAVQCQELRQRLENLGIVVDH